MFQRPCVLILLAAFLWQSLMVCGAMGLTQRAVEIEHMVVHSQDTNHHHHADNALHLDDDGDAVPHLHADSGSSTAAIPIALNIVLVVAGSMFAPEAKTDMWISNDPEVILRPPMQAA